MITLIFIVLFFGVRLRVLYNYNASTATFKVSIFYTLDIFTLTIMIIDGKYYYYINKGVPKRLKSKKKESLSSPSSSKSGSKRKSKVHSKLSLPHIKIYDTRIHITLKSDDPINNSIVGAIVNMLVAYLEHGSRVESIDGVTHDIDIGYGDFDVKLYVDVTLKYSLIAILWKYLHTIIKDKYYRRKYRVRSDRRTNGMYAR